MDATLNLKQETIKRLEYDKRKAEGNVIQEHRMVNNLRAQLESCKKEIQLLEQDIEGLRWERNAARRTADEQRHRNRKLQQELMLVKQLKKNCESIIQHLNGSIQSREQENQQAQVDLSNLLQQYLDLKQTVS